MEVREENNNDLLDIKLFRSENKFLKVFDLSPVGMAIIDANTGEFLKVNDAVLNSIGYTRDEFLQLSFWDITPSEFEEQEIQQIKDLKDHGSFGPNDKEYIRQDGSRYPIIISGIALTDVDERNIVLGIIEDISVRKAYEDKLKHLALYDPLTNLPNRLLLIDRLHQAINARNRNQSEFSLLILDLDKFKPVNDLYGHNLGDQLLKDVARRLESVIQRKTDTVARLGGDEFIILLPFFNARSDVETIAQNICEVIAQPFYIEGNKINISSSIGIAFYPEHGRDDKSLIANADLALYQVKNKSRNGFKIFEY